MMTSTGIIIPPEIVGWKVGHFATIGSTIELSCEATGYPVPMVIWIREGREERGELVEGENGTLATLTIANVSSEDAGIYECITWNFGGSVMRYALVFVKGRHCITELFLMLLAMTSSVIVTSFSPPTPSSPLLPPLSSPFSSMSSGG